MPSGAEDLAWGHGPRSFEIYLEPTCPFSARAFAKAKPLLDLVGEDRLTLKIRLNSQPWHTFSSIVSRAIFAAAFGKGGREDAFLVMQAVFENRSDFVLEEHRTGPNMMLCPSDIVSKVESLSGLELAASFAGKEITQDMKLHARIARQNGIHGTPTFVVDGLIADQLSSDGSVEAWAAYLG